MYRYFLQFLCKIQIKFGKLSHLKTSVFYYDRKLQYLQVKINRNSQPHINPIWYTRGII